MGYGATPVPGWVKKGLAALSRRRERGEARTAGVAGRQPAAVVACDEMENCWIWTAGVREAAGRRWVDFEVGDRSEGPLLRLYERLPEVGWYRSDAYPVYQ